MAEIWVMYFGAQFCIAAFSCNFKQAITKLFLFSNYRYLKSEATKHIKPTTKKIPVYMQEAPPGYDGAVLFIIGFYHRIPSSQWVSLLFTKMLFVLYGQQG